MTAGLITVTLVMLALAATLGVVYAYVQRDTSPYAPNMHDYLGDQHAASSNDDVKRAA